MADLAIVPTTINTGVDRDERHEPDLHDEINVSDDEIDLMDDVIDTTGDEILDDCWRAARTDPI